MKGSLYDPLFIFNGGIIIDQYSLTPVEIHEGLFIKRDDLYRPFGENTVNGGKLRQCYELVNHIRNDYHGVISCCSIHSPQAPITAAVANHFGMSSVICYGATTLERVRKLEMPQIAEQYGADIRIVSTSGIHNILYGHARRIAKEEGLFVVDYGFNIIDYPDIMFSAVSRQVENIPDELDNLVITCGSGITSTGVLLGLSRFNKRVGNIYLVATAPDRRKMIDGNLAANNVNIQYTTIDLFHTKGFKYKDRVYKSIDGIDLHPNYEAKTFNWLENNIDYKNERTLLWIVGAEPHLSGGKEK